MKKKRKMAILVGFFNGNLTVSEKKESTSENFEKNAINGHFSAFLLENEHFRAFFDAFSPELEC